MSARKPQLISTQATHACITNSRAARVIGGFAAAMMAASSGTSAAATDDLPGNTNSLAVVYADPSEASSIVAILPVNTELTVVCLAVPPFGPPNDVSTQPASSDGPVQHAFWKVHDETRSGYIGISDLTLSATHDGLVGSCGNEDLLEQA